MRGPRSSQALIALILVLGLPPLAGPRSVAAARSVRSCSSS